MSGFANGNRIAERLVSMMLIMFMILPCILTGELASYAADNVVEIDSFSTSFRSGGTKVNDPDLSDPDATAYVWKADNNNANHRYTFRISYTHSGTRQYQPGELEIRIPKSIIKDRNGDPADYYDVAVPVYDDPELETTTAEVKWVYKEVGDEIIIYNDRPVDAAGNGYIEVSYITSEKTYEYVDYDATGSLSDAFVATMTAKQEGIVKDAESKPIHVGMNTSAEIRWTDKRTPTLYKSWDNSWGSAAKPTEDDKYYYLIWEIRTEITGTSQPYDFYLDDKFDNIDGAVVGYKMRGESSFSEPVDGHSPVVKGIKTDFSTGRYDYVLTRHLKETYQDLSSYEMQNKVIANVHPVDEVDPDTSADSSKLWRYQRPTYTKPTGHFMLYKWGNDYRDRHVKSSEDIRNFGLDDFKKGKTDSISDLRYEVQQIGYQWPWTIEDGEDWRVPENYGKKNVKYTLWDNEFYLNETELPGGDITYDGEYDKSKKLTSDDYELQYITFDYSANDAIFDEDKQGFVSKSADYSNDTIDFYAEFSGDGDWIKVGTYNVSTGTWSDIDDAHVESAKGRRLNFKADATGWRADYENAHYYTGLIVNPYVRLKDSDRVMEEIKDMDKINLLNVNHSRVKDYKDRTIVDFDKSGNDWIIGVNKDGHIEKNVTKYNNNKIKRLYTIGWSSSIYEDYRVNGGSRVMTMQESGTFYDLLPLGGELSASSIKVYGDGLELDENAYDYEVKKNYKDTGRDLLVVKIKDPAKKYTLTYDSVHSWEAIKDFGTEALNNIAYETGNEDIGDGYPDNGGKSGVDAFKQLNDDPSDDKTGEKFLYAAAKHDINIITAAALNINKKVKSENQETYTYDTIVYRDSEYSYRIRFASDENILAKGLIVYDSLENYKVNITDDDQAVVETRESDWHGTLKSIDLTQVKKLGIAPVVYYSPIAKLAITGNTGAAKSGNTYDYDDVVLSNVTDSSGEKIWYTESEFIAKYGDIAKAKAFAVDLRKDSKSEDYILPSDTSVAITVIMQSPDSIEKNTHGRYDAYNNVWLVSSVTSGDEPVHFPPASLDHQDYTKVSYRATGDIKMTKVNVEAPSAGVEGITFRLTGTSIYGEEIDEKRITSSDGTFTFKKIPQGDYELQEIKANDDWLEDHTVYHVHIDDVGKVTIDELTDGILTVGKVVRGEDKNEGRYLVANTPRIHGDLKFRKKSLGQDSDLVDVVKKISVITPLADLDVDVIKADPSQLKVSIDGTDFIVLAKEDGKALLMQCETTDAIADGFDVNKADWSNSNIRTYLNGDYLEGRDILNQIILESNVKTRNAQNGTSFIDTQDKAFLLSAADINPNGRLYTTIMWQPDDFTIPAAQGGALKFDKIKEAVELGGTSPYTATRTAYKTTFHAYTTSINNLAMNYSSLPSAALAHPVMWVAVDNSLTTQVNLSDTTFKLEGTSDYGTEVLEYATSTMVGRVTFTNLEKGTYKLTEVKAKDGFIINQTEWTVKVDDSGNVFIADEDTGDALVDVKSDKRGEQYLQNEEYHSFSLRKVDAKLRSRWLNGAVFNLSGTSNYGTKVNLTKESGAEGVKGVLHFDGLEAGTYVLREVEPPTGVDEDGFKGGTLNYVADPDPHIVTIDIYGNVTIDGLEHVIDTDDGKEIPNYYDVENDRALDGRIKVIKKWKDGLTNEEREAAGVPEPRVTVSSQEPEQDHITLTINWDDGLLSASKRPTVIPYLIDDEGNVIETGNPSGWIKNGDKWTYTFGVTINDNTNYETYVKLTKDGSTETTIYTTDSVRNGLSSEHPVVVHNHSASINLVDNSEAYAKFDSATGVMTFFRDEKYNASAGTGHADKSTDGTLTYYRGMESGEYASDYSRPWNDIAKGSNSSVTKLVFEDGIKPSSTKYWFYNMQNLEEIEGLELLDTSNVGSMHMMFMLCKSLTSLDISSFDLSNVGSLQGAFSNLTSLKTIEMPTLGKGSTSKLHNATAMFQGCTMLQSVDLSAFDFSGVTRTENMFNGCYAISNIYVDSNTWTVANVTSGSYMFGGCSNLPHYIEGYTDVGLAFVGEDPNGTWGYLSDISESGSKGTSSTASIASITNSMAPSLIGNSVITSSYSLLSGRIGLMSAPAKAPAASATVESSGTIGSGTSAWPWTLYSDGTFVIGEEGKNYKIGRISSYNSLAKAIIGNIDTTTRNKVKNLEFAGTVEVLTNGTPYGISRMFTTTFNTTNENYTMADSDKSFPNLVSVDFTNTKGYSNGSNYDEPAMFRGYSKLKSVNFGDLDLNFNMNWAFADCTSLKTVDWGNTNLDDVYKFDYMFFNCSNIEKAEDVIGNIRLTSTATKVYLNSLFYKSGIKSADLTGVDLSNVKDVGSMFSTCPNLVHVKMGGVDLGEAGSFKYMFYDCKNLIDVDMSGIYADKVTSCEAMFRECENLKDVNLENGGTSKVTSFVNMFYGCKNLEKVNMRGCTNDSVQSQNYQWMFYGCKNLKGVDISTFDFVNHTGTNDMFAESSIQAICLGSDTIISDIGSFEKSTDVMSKQWQRYATLAGRRVGNEQDTYIGGYSLNYDGSRPGWYKIKGTTAFNEADMWEQFITTEDPNAVPDDNDTGEPKLKWKKIDDETWEYTFEVFNDQQEYYVWEDKIEGYYSDTYKADYQIMNDENGNNIKQVTITNSKDKPEEDEKKYGDLSLTKTVAPADGETLTAQDKSREFAFTITLTGHEGIEMLSGTVATATDEGTGNVSVTKEKRDVVFRDGVGTVYLKHGQTFALKGLSEGTKYSIAEQELTDYIQSATQNDGSNGISYDVITDLSDLGLRDLVWVEDTENGGYKQVEFYQVQKAARAGEITLYIRSIGASGTINEDDPQDVYFVNTRKSEEDQPHNGFKLVKNVKGTLGDVTKEFEYYIALANLNQDTEYTYSIKKRGCPAESFTFTSNNRGEAILEIKLRDDDMFEITGLPAKKKDARDSVGATYRITEVASDHIASYVIRDAYDGPYNKITDTASLTADSEVYIYDNVSERYVKTTFGAVDTGTDVFEKGEYEKKIEQSRMGNSENDKSLSTKTETVDEYEDITVEYVNRRDINTETGIVEATWPWNIILLLILLYLAYEDRMRRAKNRMRRGMTGDALV